MGLASGLKTVRTIRGLMSHTAVGTDKHSKSKCSTGTDWEHCFLIQHTITLKLSQLIYVFNLIVTFFLILLILFIIHAC